MDKKKILLVFFVLVIFFGMFLRFYGLDSQYLIGDEPVIAIGGMKFAHSSFKDSISYLPENVPFGIVILGIPSFFIDADYENLGLLNPMTYIIGFISYDAISKNYVPMKLLLGFLGILSLLLIYLISKELFGKKAAFWSLVVSAISFDLIIYNRILYLQTFLIFFSLGTIFFFLKYVKSKLKIRFIYFLLICLFLFFAVGSRSGEPWLLIPVLIASQFIFNRKLREDILVSVGYVLTFGLMWLIYSLSVEVSPTESISLIYDASASFFGTVIGLISFTFHDIVLGFLLRNNYVLGLVSLICIFMFFKLLYRKKLIGLVRSLIVKKDLRLVILLLFVVGFVGLGFTVLGDEMRHLMFLFIPLYIYSGAVIEKIVKKRFVLGFVILLILVSCVQGVLNFPSSTINYSNFGVSSYHTQNYNEETNKKILSYLESLGNPAVISNHINTLVFYEGNKGPLTMPFSYCAPELFMGFKQHNILILYHGHFDENDDIKLTVDPDTKFPYFCDLFEKIKLEKIRKFSDDLILYRVA